MFRNGRIRRQRPRFVAAVLGHRFHAAIIMQPRSCWRICFWGNGGARGDFRIYDCRGISQAQEQDNIARYFRAPTKMSEYQYYEFQRVDERLSEKEMQELRAYSTRARITPTSFINEYHFGSFKGNEDAWMEKYFDGFLYLANWGTHEVQLALPSTRSKRRTITRNVSTKRGESRLLRATRKVEEPWLPRNEIVFVPDAVSKNKPSEATERKQGTGRPIHRRGGRGCLR